MWILCVIFLLFKLSQFKVWGLIILEFTMCIDFIQFVEHWVTFEDQDFQLFQDLGLALCSMLWVENT
jgi:hypothetical protein